MAGSVISQEASLALRLAFQAAFQSRYAFIGGLAVGRGDPVDGKKLVGAAGQVARGRAVAAGLAVVERRAVVEPLVIDLGHAAVGAAPVMLVR